MAPPEDIVVNSDTGYNEKNPTEIQNGEFAREWISKIKWHRRFKAKRHWQEAWYRNNGFTTSWNDALDVTEA